MNICNLCNKALKRIHTPCHSTTNHSKWKKLQDNADKYWTINFISLPPVSIAFRYLLKLFYILLFIGLISGSKMCIYVTTGIKNSFIHANVQNKEMYNKKMISCYLVIVYTTIYVYIYICVCVFIFVV